MMKHWWFMCAQTDQTGITGLASGGFILYPNPVKARMTLVKEVGQIGKVEVRVIGLNDGDFFVIYLALSPNYDYLIKKDGL